MDQSATELMLQYAAASRKRIQGAESEFNHQNALIQRKASRNIDLFGGSATNQVVDIASDARRACDDLYSAYQTEIQLLDEACRPLLDQNPSLEAVKEVCELIKECNEESEIENNFTASLNGRDLGGVASGKYVPAMASKMIQRYWEAKYDSWPGRAEELAAAEEKRRQEEQAKQAAAKEQLKNYEKIYQAWKQETDAIEETRAAELKKALDQAKADRIAEIEQTYLQKTEKAKAAKALCEQKKAAAEAELAALGMFKFAEKKAAKTTIEEMSADIRKADQDLKSAEECRKKENDELDSTLSKKKEKLLQELDKKFPLPKKPRKPFVPRTGDSYTERQIAEDQAKQEILNTLERIGPATLADIQAANPVLEDLSTQRVSAYLRLLTDDGYVEKFYENRCAYFSV